MVSVRLKMQHTGVGIGARGATADGAGAAKTVHADRNVAAANAYFMMSNDKHN